MPFAHPLVALLSAFAIGLLIGVERGWAQRDAGEGQRIAGVRTYALLGLLGGVIGIVSLGSGPAVLAVGVVAVTLVLTAAYIMDSRSGSDIGITSAVAALTTFVFAAAAGRGHVELAGVGAGIMALLLGLKPELHGWLERISRDELKAAFKLLLVSVVLLPILPDRAYGPWNALNPREIWWFVVLITGLSFAGYIAVRAIGPKRGMLATGIFGGLASSTALTLHFSRLARREERLAPVLAGGILFASTAMPLRVLIIVAVIAWPLVIGLAVPLLAMMAVTLVSALWLSRRQPAGNAEEVRSLINPAALLPAIAFGIALAAILLLIAAVQAWFGAAGVLTVSFISGTINVAAMAVSLADAVTAGNSPTLAIAGIVLAASANSLARAAMAWSIGGARLARHAVPVLLLTAMVGGLATAAILTGYLPTLAN